MPIIIHCKFLVLLTDRDYEKYRTSSAMQTLNILISQDTPDLHYILFTTGERRKKKKKEKKNRERSFKK